MRSFDNRYEEDNEDAIFTANGRPRPMRSRTSKKVQPRRKAKSKRTPTDATAKRGMHQRRNKRLSW